MDRQQDALRGVAGTPVDAAVEEVVDAGRSRDPEDVRRTLDPVADDGVVTAAAFDETVSDVSKVVSTAETRAELVEIEFGDAESAAEPHADLPAVAARLDDFSAELDRVTARAAELTDDLRAAIGRPDDAESLYEVVSDLRAVASAAQTVQTEADHLQVDLEEFGRWIADPDHWVRELGDDVDAVAQSVETLEDAVDRLESAVDSEPIPDDVDPALAWFDATVRHRTAALLAADVRAELDDVEALAARQGVDSVEPLVARLDELSARREAVGDALDALERPAWREAYGERLAAFEGDLDGFEPPVSWGAVRATLDDHRPATDGA